MYINRIFGQGMRSSTESEHMSEVTTILGLCRAKVADYFFSSKVEATVASALVSKVFVDLPLEPKLLDLFEPLGKFLTI
jgi:hypothetical protein